MTRWTRRDFGRFAATAGLITVSGAGAAHKRAWGKGQSRVVVIGAGAGGATAAKYLAQISDRIDVTLVEANAQYTTCFFSNLYLGGFRSFESITHSYDALKSKYGIRFVHASAIGIDPDKRSVKLKSADSLPYDRLIVAPGIDFKYDAIEGYDEAAAQVMPHAWKAGPQTELLRRQLGDMEDGGLFLVAPPPDPFRCPPGPYERASMAACYFKQSKPKSKVLILDAKHGFSKQTLFLDAWSRYYSGMIEWLPVDFTEGVKAVDVKTMSIMTGDERFKPAVANIIPPQIAGRIAQVSGLVDRSGWCPVDPNTLESTLHPGIHLIGDAIDPGDMPKSAFAANSQAKVCAMSVAAALTGSKAFHARFRNTCWSFLGKDDAVKVGASYKPTGGKIGKIDGFISEVGESSELRAETAREARAWYEAITEDIFG